MQENSEQWLINVAIVIQRVSIGLEVENYVISLTGGKRLKLQLFQSINRSAVDKR